MSEDIVVRLRTRATDEFEMLDNIHEPLLEAADEIERLARENAALLAERNDLRQYAKDADKAAFEIAQDYLAARRERDALREAMHKACDLLAERTFGNRARSPGHNARVVLEAALSPPAQASAPNQEQRS